MKTREYQVRVWPDCMESRSGYHLSSHVVAEKHLGHHAYTITVIPDGRMFTSTRTLREARAIAERVELTRPTFDRDGRITQAALKRLRPCAPAVRRVG